MSRIAGDPDISMYRASGLSLRVARWRSNSPDKAPLLFINGIGADIAAASPLLGRLHGRDAWTLDMPGVGESPDALWPYSAQSMAAAVMEIADQFDMPQIDLAGFSWGGAIAQQIAVQFPARIRRMVLMATAPFVSSPDIGWGTAMDSDMQANALRLPTATPLGIAYQTMAMVGWTSAAQLPGLKHLPTLILMGEQDGVMPSCHGQLLAQLIPGATLEIVAGGAHMFPFTLAAKVAGRISDFLDQPLPDRQAAA